MLLCYIVKLKYQQCNITAADYQRKFYLGFIKVDQGHHMP